MSQTARQSALRWVLSVVLAGLGVAGCGSDGERSGSPTGNVKGGQSFADCLSAAGVTIARSPADLKFLKPDSYGAYGASDTVGVVGKDHVGVSVKSLPEGAYRIYAAFPEDDRHDLKRAIKDPSTADVVGYLRPDSAAKARRADACFETTTTIGVSTTTEVAQPPANSDDSASPEEKAVRATVDAYWSAFFRGDGAKACALMTDKAVADLRRESGSGAAQQSCATIVNGFDGFFDDSLRPSRVTVTQVSATSATVDALFDKPLSSQKMALVLVDGRWLVDKSDDK